MCFCISRDLKRTPLARLTVWLHSNGQPGLKPADRSASALRSVIRRRRRSGRCVGAFR
jgi:hypothetical protein